MSRTNYGEHIERALEREGWFLQPEALDRTWQDMQETEMVPTKIVEKEDLESSIRQELLNTDLRKIGAPCLPDSRTLQQLTKIRGPIVLQVVSITNVAESSKKSCLTGHLNNRLLRLRLTDGHTNVTAIEHQPIDFLLLDIPPGTKVLLRGMVTVHSGILMLDAQSIRILGGHVRALHEAWEVDRKYSGLARSAALKGLPDGVSGPPPFRPFRSTKKAPANEERKHFQQAPVDSVVAVASLQPVKLIDQHESQDMQQSVDSGQVRRTVGRIKPGSEPYKPRSAQNAEAPAVTSVNLTHGERPSTVRTNSTVQPEQCVQGEDHTRPVSSGSTSADASPAELMVTSPRKSTQSNGNEKGYALKQVIPSGPEVAPVQNRAAAQKLLGKWAAHDRGGRGRGGSGRSDVESEGRGRGRGGRRGRRAEEEDEHVLTWDEWEARKAPLFFSPASDVTVSSVDIMKSDEDLARRLQQRLDLETVKVQKTLDEAEQLRLSMFNYVGENEDIEDSYRGWGRGRGRGRGRGGRGRGR